jgi:hypothetical protein
MGARGSYESKRTVSEQAGVEALGTPSDVARAVADAFTA